MWIAQNALGINSRNVADVADKIATKEKEHADELAERIVELSGGPRRTSTKSEEWQIVQPLNSLRTHRTDENG